MESASGTQDQGDLALPGYLKTCSPGTWEQLGVCPGTSLDALGWLLAGAGESRAALSALLCGLGAEGRELFPGIPGPRELFTRSSVESSQPSPCCLEKLAG